MRFTSLRIVSPSLVKQSLVCITRASLRRSTSAYARMVDFTDQVIVRTTPEDATLTISLTVLGRQRNLQRGKTEEVAKALKRIQLSAAPKPDKKQKRKGSQAEDAAPAEVFVGLFEGPSTTSALVPLDTSNHHAWQAGRVLQVGDTLFRVTINPPTVDKVETLGNALSGFPIVPVASFRFADESLSNWRWLRKTLGAKQAGIWEDTGCGSRFYIPSAEDVGAMLRVECTPATVDRSSSDVGSSGLAYGEPVGVEIGPVAAGPTVLAHPPRFAMTSSVTTPPVVRVVSYNILAEQYAAMEYSKTVLYSWCEPGALDTENRRPLLARELLEYNADILCLQEVDEKMFSKFLLPFLNFHGYGGVYSNKDGGVSEGEALFFRSSRYRLLMWENLMLREVFKELQSPTSPQDERGSGSWEAQAAPLLAASPHLGDALQKVTTIAQLAILVPHRLPHDDAPPIHEAEGPVCIVNTHLFYHPRAPHIRTLHTVAIGHCVEELIRKAQDKHAEELHGRPPAVVWCGDLNSSVTDKMPGAVQLLRHGHLPGSFWDWQVGATFKFTDGKAADNLGESPEQESLDERPESPQGSTVPASSGVVGVDVNIPFRLRSSDDLLTPFSNHVKGFTSLLDYVFFEPLRMRSLRVIPTPNEEECAGWIPNLRFPSDHLPIISELEWLPLCDQKHWRRGGTPFSGSHGTSTVPSSSHTLGCLHPLPAHTHFATAAAASLRCGEAIILPLPTGYGLASCAVTVAGVCALQGLRQSRGAPELMVQDVSAVQRYAAVQHLPATLLEHLLGTCGATVLLRTNDDCCLAPDMVQQDHVIAVRTAPTPFIEAVIRAMDGPLAVSPLPCSSGDASPGLSSLHNLQHLWTSCGEAFSHVGHMEVVEEGTRVDLTSAASFHVVCEGRAAQEVVQCLKDAGLRPTG